MSNQFIGLTMLVTLNDPPGAQLRGVVSSIEPGKSLTLRNGNGAYPLVLYDLLIWCYSHGPIEWQIPT